MTALQRPTGLAMIAVPVLFMAAFTGLQLSFHYPDILREPAEDILACWPIGMCSCSRRWPSSRLAC